MKYTKTIVVSAVNIVEGGALSILKNCIKELVLYTRDKDFDIVVLVHSSDLLPKYENVEYISFPKSKKSFIYRLFFEYIYFYFVSLKFRPWIWLSLHDMTPFVYSKYQYVYMHNPSPFFKRVKGIKLTRKFKIFIMLYKYLYRINVKRNTAIIVQQEWFRDGICKLCKVSKDKIIVAYPENTKNQKSILAEQVYKKAQFFYNAFPREFKNFEVICKAAEILAKRKLDNLDWNIYLTIDGTENAYSSSIVTQYKNNSHLHFIGLISRDECEDYYQSSECLIFPSLLETWGLPISEFKIYKKKMVLSDLSFAYEAAAGADEVCFFDPSNADMLADIIESVIRCEEKYFTTLEYKKIQEPYCDSWVSLFDRIIK